MKTRRYKQALTVAVAATFVSGIALTAPGAGAVEPEPEPYCQGGPTTNRFGDPSYMYEISWGQPDRFGGSPTIDPADLGGAPTILWNGQPAEYLDNHLYLRYDDGGVTGNWGTHPNTPTNGTRINYSFPDGTEWTADVSSGPHGCEPQVTWTPENLPYEPPAEVARPEAAATIAVNKPRVARVEVTASQPEGTVPTAKGAYYKVLKVNPRTNWTERVAAGRIHADATDRLRVVFPKAEKKMQVRVVSYGEVIAQKKVRVR